MATTVEQRSALVLRCKVAIVGESKVGKSALAQMFCNNMSKYPKNYIMTTGLDFSVKEVKIPDTNVIVEMYLFDTSGSPVYQKLRAKYWQGSAMLMLVFDMSDEKSFERCTEWYKEYKATIAPLPVKGVLVGTKADLKEEHAVMVSPEKVLDFANSIKFRFFATSSKEMRGVEDPFHYAAAQFNSHYQEEVKTLAGFT